MLDFGRFEALTFDCYGTLVDWESGILEALGVLLGQDATTDSDALLEEFGDEWGNKWMFHYRWAREADQTACSRRLAELMAPGARPIEIVKDGKLVRDLLA